MTDDVQQTKTGLRWAPGRLVAAGISMSLLLVIFSLVAVGSGQVGVVVRAGEDTPVRLLDQPGFYVRIPFIDRAWLIDTRVQTTTQTTAQTVTTEDKQSLGLSAWAAWRVTDPVRFSQATNAGKTPVDTRISAALHRAIDELAQKLPAAALMAGLQAGQKADLQSLLNSNLEMLGVSAVATGISRILPPEEEIQTIYQKMGAQQQDASRLLVQGLQSDTQQLLQLQGKQREQVLTDAARAAQQQRQQADTRALAALSARYGSVSDFQGAMSSSTSLPVAGPAPTVSPGAAP